MGSSLEFVGGSKIIYYFYSIEFHICCSLFVYVVCTCTYKINVILVFRQLNDVWKSAKARSLRHILELSEQQIQYVYYRSTTYNYSRPKLVIGIIILYNNYIFNLTYYQ